MKHVLQIKTVTTCPDIWKLTETIFNYALFISDLQSRTGIGTAMIVEMIAGINHSTDTHQFRSLITLNSKFPLCTTKSIDATISSFKVATVFSIRSSQRLF